MHRCLYPLLLALLIISPFVAAQPPAAAHPSATALFAGGCFWGVEAAFEKLPGVLNVESGFTGGHVPHPTYDQVSTGGTGHVEAVRITYDPAVITYARLLDHFWHNIDPTVKGRQFCETGPQYRTAIFYLDDAQRQTAEASKTALLKSGKLNHVRVPVKVDSKSYPPEFQLEAMRNAEADARLAEQDQPREKVQTEIRPAGPFYLAEEAHQDYYKKHPIRFNIYGLQCGRAARLQHIWGKEAK